MLLLALPLRLLLVLLLQEDVLTSLDLSRRIFARIRLNYIWVGGRFGLLSTISSSKSSTLDQMTGCLPCS